LLCFMIMKRISLLDSRTGNRRITSYHARRNGRCWAPR
jgi:hypothetical protein